MAAEEERPRSPIEEYLKGLINLPVYQEFAQNAEAISPPPEPLSLAKSRLVSQDGDNKFTYDLQVSTAHFLMSLDTGFETPGVNITYPSRLSHIDPDEIHHFITGLIDIAYPQRGYTPSVALIENGREVRLDLTNYWDGKTYEKYLPNTSLSAIIFYLNIPLPFSMPASLPSMGSRMPDFMYGFRRGDSDWQEFIQMSYLQAVSSSRELAREFLPRNRGYYGGDHIQDSEDLANTMRELCKTHPQKTIRYS